MLSILLAVLGLVGQDTGIVTDMDPDFDMLTLTLALALTWTLTL